MGRPGGPPEEWDITAIMDLLPHRYPFLLVDRITSIEEGVRNELQRGYIAGFPCINVHVSLTDGSYHDVDSSEHAFVAAGNARHHQVIHHQRRACGAVVLPGIGHFDVPEKLSGETMQRE